MCSRYYCSSCISCFAFNVFLAVICGALHFTMWQTGCKKIFSERAQFCHRHKSKKNTSSNLTAYCLNVFGVSRQPQSPLALKSFSWLRIKLIRPRSFQENKLPSAINRLAIMLMGDCSYGDHMRLKLS